MGLFTPCKYRSKNRTPRDIHGAMVWRHILNGPAPLVLHHGREEKDKFMSDAYQSNDTK